MYQQKSFYKSVLVFLFQSVGICFFYDCRNKIILNHFIVLKFFLKSNIKYNLRMN